MRKGEKRSVERERKTCLWEPSPLPEMAGGAGNETSSSRGMNRKGRKVRE